MWRFVRQRVLKFAFAWSADFASRYRCELWMHFYQWPVKLGLQFCRICGIVRCSDKSQLALVCSDVFIFYPLQQLKLSLRYLGHISWRILLYTRIPLNLPNEVLDVIPEVSDSRISASCLQDWFLLLFFQFWHILFFYPELRVYPERIMAEIWAALPLRGADPHREKVLLLGEVAGNWCWSVFLFVIGPSVIGLLKPKFGSFQLAHFSCRLDTSIVSFFNGIGAFHCWSFSPRNALAVDVSRSQSACSKRSPQYLTRDWRILRRLCCTSCASDIEVDHYMPSSNHLSVSHLEASKADGMPTSSEWALRALPPCTACWSWIVKVKSFTALGYEEM